MTADNLCNLSLKYKRISPFKYYLQINGELIFI